MIIEESADTRVNSYTAGAQIFPSIGKLTGGGYVVTWTSDLQDGSGYGVYAQRYDANGLPTGGEIRVNATTNSYQYSSSVTGLIDGSYVVTWQSSQSEDYGIQYDIYAQRYSAAGVPQGGETRVNSFIQNTQSNAQTASLSDGGYVVTWISDGQDGSGTGVYAQRYDAQGMTQGTEVRVNTTVTGYQQTQSVAGLAGGGYVVTWMGPNTSDGQSAIYTQRYSAAGAALGGEIRQGAGESYSYGYYPAVTALTDGGYAIAWTGNDSTGYGVHVQRYAADGAANGNEILVQYNFLNTDSLDIDAQPGGGFVVTWQGYDASGTQALLTRSYDAAGAPVTPAIPLTTNFTNGYDFGSAVLENGKLVFVYDGNDGSQQGILQRVIDLAGASGGTTTSAGVEIAAGTDGDDIFHVAPGTIAVGDVIVGGDGFDTIEISSAGAIDFSVASLGGIEQIVGTAGNDRLTFTGHQLNAFSNFDLGGGDDTLVVKGLANLVDKV